MIWRELTFAATKLIKLLQKEISILVEELVPALHIAAGAFVGTLEGLEMFSKISVRA